MAIKNLVTLGIGPSATIPYFVTLGLTPNEANLTYIALTLRSRSTALTLDSRSTGLTLRTRSTALTLEDRE